MHFSKNTFQKHIQLSSFNTTKMSDNNLKSYIEQALKIRETQETVSTDEMQKIALSLGLTEADLSKVEDVFKGAVLRGQGFMKFEDYESAIKEFEYALVLKPNNAEVLQGLAYCYTHFAVINEDKKIYQKAQETIKNALLINPNHEKSYLISSELNRGLKNINLKRLKNTPSTPNYKKRVPSIRPKIFAKSRTDNKISGVLGGIANYLGMSSFALRAIVIFAGFISWGSILFPYIFLAILMKKEPLDNDY